MKEERLEQLISIACLICGMASFLLICLHWAAGLAAALGAIGLGIFHGRKYQWNRMTKGGVICGSVYIGFALLVLLSIRIYYSIIHL